LKIITSRFGIIEVSEEEIIHMPQGMIGFSEYKDFVLLKHAEGSPFLWFQSVQKDTLAFVLIDPFLFKPDYEIQITEDDKRELEWNGAQEGIEALVVINLSDKAPSMRITANLLAPIIINIKKRLAKQVILYNSPYSHRYPLPLKNNGETSKIG
jgi:flagellar assembly factor FliW